MEETKGADKEGSFLQATCQMGTDPNMEIGRPRTLWVWFKGSCSKPDPFRHPAVTKMVPGPALPDQRGRQTPHWTAVALSGQCWVSPEQVPNPDYGISGRAS